MDSAKFVKVEKIFTQELCGDKQGAYALTVCFDKIISNTRIEENNELNVMFALVDAYWQGYDAHSMR